MHVGRDTLPNQKRLYFDTNEKCDGNKQHPNPYTAQGIVHRIAGEPRRQHGQKRKAQT